MFSGTLADLGVAIPAALILRNAWALVFGLLAGNFVRMVVSYFIHPYRAKLYLERTKGKELYAFGRWILMNNAVLFLATYGGDVFLGKVLGTTALGLYQMAFRISNLAATEFAKTVSIVMFPAYARIQDNIPKLREAFLMTIKITMSTSLPLVVVMWLLAPDFVRLFLGEAWVPMISPLRLLTILTVIRPLIGTGGALFRAVGRPEIDFWMNFTRAGVVGAVIYPLTTAYGVNGVATAIIIGYFTVIPIWWLASFRILKWRSGELLKQLLSTLAGVGVMSFSLFLTRQWLNTRSFLGFAGVLAIAAGTYIAFQTLVWKRFHGSSFLSLYRRLVK